MPVPSSTKRPIANRVTKSTNSIRHHGKDSKMQSLCRLGWFVLSWGLFAVICHAQAPPTADRNNMLDGLWRTLVDSQLKLDGAPDRRPAGSTATAQVTTEFRRAAEDFAAESAQLISALQFETRYDLNARALLGDAVRLRAAVDILLRRLQAGIDPTTDYNAVDAQWRALSHQLKQFTNTSSAIAQRVAAMDTLSQAMSKSLRVSPQFDRSELEHQFASLVYGLEQLASDIELDLYNNPQRDAWARQARELRSRAQGLLMAATSNYTHRDIVNYYKQFYDAWMPMKRELRSEENRYLQRNLNRISQINERLHTLLWLPPVIDGRDILYLAESLHRNVELVSDRISLRQMLVLNNAADVFSRARDFFALSDEFRRVVARETNLESIRYDFRVLDAAWFDLRAVLGPIDDGRTVQYIALLDDALGELRNSLGLETAFDRSAAEQLASSLSNSADLLAYDVQRYVGRSTAYSPQVRDGALQSADNLRRASRELYLGISQNADANSLKSQFRQLSQQWDRLQNVLGQLSVTDRSQIARSYQAIGPAIAKLQVLYTY